MDINKICEEIVSDITGRTTISEILLKTQLLSAMTGVEAFEKWVGQEQNGYEKPLEVPDYRKLHCNITASLSIPYHVGITEMNVPIDAIQHNGAREMLSTVFFDRPAVEAERLALSSENNQLRKPTPGMSHQFVQPLFPNAHVEAVYQDLSPTSFLSLLESVKSRILDFILQLEKKGVVSLSLNKPVNQTEVNKIFLQTIYGSVVNNGEGTIEAESILLTPQDAISPKDVEKLKTMISRLNVLMEVEQEPLVHETAISLNQEINAECPRKSVMKKELAIIKGLAMGAASSEIATIINSALGIM